MSDKIAICIAFIAAMSVFIGGGCMFIFFTLVDISKDTESIVCELRRFNNREEGKK